MHRRPTPSTEPTLRQALRMIAAPEGFLGRQSDGKPGPRTGWRRLQRLDDITHIYRAFTHQPACGRGG
ncbi:IS4 family transposase [Banduia mediterranea]|uniref:IS4 family transposase n=1 Tax=Banduia mediterranea TaxID=3075609 RepID=UPI003D786CA5